MRGRTIRLVFLALCLSIAPATIAAAGPGSDGGGDRNASPDATLARVVGNELRINLTELRETPGTNATEIVLDAPPGLGAEDPWVDANGDAMFGDLEMGRNAVILQGLPLSATSDGQLQFDGQNLCLEGSGCGSSLSGETPIVVDGSTIKLSSTGCQAGDLWKWSGSAWDCRTDEDTTYDGSDFALSDQSCALGEVVTGVDANGAVSCAPDQDTLTSLDCAADEIARQADTDGDGAADDWACSADRDTTYDGSDFALSDQTCSAGDVVAGVNASGGLVCEEGASAAAWLLGGNDGTTPSSDFLGTTDDARLIVKVNDTTALVVEPSGGTPNIVGGDAANHVAEGVEAATIGGGGPSHPDRPSTTNNSVTDRWGTVGGGGGNTAGDGPAKVRNAEYATVGGGANNTASGVNATVAGGGNNTADHDWATAGGGGDNNASGYGDTVSGGLENQAEGPVATVGGGRSNLADGRYATVAGGNDNEAQGYYATIGGGVNNVAHGFWVPGTVSGGSGNTADGDGSTVGGGSGNLAAGHLSTIPGGTDNIAGGDRSFAAGAGANASHDGAFVWSDSTSDTEDSFGSTGPNQFLVNASGGVGIGTGSPVSQLDVNGTMTADDADLGAGSIGSSELADGSVGSAEAADGALGSAEIEDGTIASADVDSSSVQERVTGTCSSGSALGAVDASGGVTCNDLGWVDGGSSIQLADTGDKVAIGTTDPSDDLHVDGEINVSDGSVDGWDASTSSYSDLQLARDQGGTPEESWFRVFENGTEQMRIRDGDEAAADFDGAVNANGLDLAETYVPAEPMDAGELVAVSSTGTNEVRKTDEARDPGLIGVVSTDPGVVLGPGLASEEEVAETFGPDVLAQYEGAEPQLVQQILAEHPDLPTERAEKLALDMFVEEELVRVALAGRVPVEVSAENGPIEAGDPLTSSSVPGVAMKATGDAPVVGKALGPLASGTGEIQVFVDPGRHDAQDEERRIDELEQRVSQLEEENERLEQRVQKLEELEERIEDLEAQH